MNDGRPEAESTKEIVESWLKNTEMEQATAYNNHGRAFAALDARELASRWKAAFAAWAADPADWNVMQLVEDLGSEFRLRGSDPPERECKAAFEQLKARLRIEWQKLRNDPVRFRQAAERFGKQLMDFQERAGVRAN